MAVVVTLHRLPNEVDRRKAERWPRHWSLQAKLPLVFLVHSARRSNKSGLAGKLTAAGVKLVEPPSPQSGSLVGIAAGRHRQRWMRRERPPLASAPDASSKYREADHDQRGDQTGQ
jgi:hypothetical protein